MQIDKAKAIAEKIKTLLAVACERINMDGSDQPAIIIAGSIRRLKPDVGDIEFLCIPKYVAGADMLDAKIKTLIQLDVLDYRLNKLGRRIYGPQNKLLVHKESGIGVDIFSTTEECWPVALVVRTGGKISNMEIATRALERGMKFRAYGDGFDTPEGHIRCETEEDVFRAVGLRCLPPEQRK